MRRADTGLPKLWVTHCALTLRAAHPEWFDGGAAYTPMPATGGRAENLVGFLRAGRVAAIVPRWSLKVGDSWGATTIELPTGRWRNILAGDQFEGGRQRAQVILRRFPVALLVMDEHLAPGNPAKESQ